jgi:NAD(P)H-flavin reductase
MDENKKAVSFFGDTHTAFAGSVVKAMASAKNGYKPINDSLQNLKKDDNYKKFLSGIDEQFKVKVKELNILSPNVFELIVNAPLVAKKTKLGHIFRLHNYHSLATKKEGTLLAMEGVALTTYKVDQEKGEIGVIVINAGGSSSIVKDLKVNENIIFMGPSGTPNHIAKNKEVVFLAAGRGIFPLASLAKAHKEQGCKVTLFCGFKKESDIVRLDELKDACDNLVISTQDYTLDQFIVNDPNSNKGGVTQKVNYYKGDLVEAFISFAKQDKPKIDLNYSNIDLIFCMGNEDMMHKVAKARHDELKEELKDTHISITSLNNPMQCMLKGVCSQCLQKKTDPKTGQERYFYSCISQDQKSDEIDFEFLKNRCTQNSLQEKLTKDWVKYLN